MKNNLTLVLIILCQFSFGQVKSILKGTVIEEANGRTLPAVNVLIKGTKFATTTDADGNFIFRNIEIGKYEVQFSTIGFDTKLISDVEVVKDDAIALNVSMVEKKNVLDEVIITKVKAKAESIKSLLTAQKNSVRVSDGISAETIKRTPDRTTSDVLKRISGASIQDNKFVIIRGLNERYNTSYLNGSPLPSSEPDRKAFSFDIFPANMLDNLVIYKTASPDLPGEFAGGVIEINTKSVPDKNFQSFSIGGGYNTATTGKEQVYANGSKSDWIGVDSGKRALPTYFPSVLEFQALQNTPNSNNNTIISNLAKNYVTDWSLLTKTFLPNFSFQYTIGRHVKAKDKTDFGYLFSLSNNVTNNYTQVTRRTYEVPTVLETDLSDNSYATQTLFGAIANLSLKLNENNTIYFKNLYSINTDNRVITREGQINQEIEPVLIKNSNRLFTSNKIYSGQLIGEHFLTTSKIKISWNGSYSKIDRDTPNDRRNAYNYVRNLDGTTTTPAASFNVRTIGTETPGTFFSANNLEDISSAKIDVSKKVKINNSISLDFKAGLYTQSRNRIFTTRLMGYVPLVGNINGTNYTINNFQSATLSILPENQIFNPANFGIISPGKTGFTFFDATKQSDSYTAASKLNSAYLMLDDTFGKFRLVWGLRVEGYLQTLDSKTDANVPLVVENAQVDYLPSANLIVGITKKQNIRLSYSKTVNRPEFRELAPFVFYDAATRFITGGTPTLKIATIQNADFRYEIFPGKGQLFSLSAFFKKFKDPIEIQALANNSNQYKNASSGEARGIELEYRTLIGSIFGSENKVVNDITFYTNIAVIRSKVDISNLFTVDTIPDTPLQGQSPYVANAGLQYQNSQNGFGASINFNRVGDRIALQANQTPGNFVPAIWEKSRSFLDFQISKNFFQNKLELKFNAQNILAENLIFYSNNDAGTEAKQGFEALANNIFTGTRENRNGYNPDVDDLIASTKLGKTFSFSVTYNF